MFIITKMSLIRKEIAVVGIFILILIFIFYGKYLFIHGESLPLHVMDDPAYAISYFPSETHTIKSLRLGRLPLWNPHLAMGQPHIANIQTAFFSPFKALIYLFPSWQMRDITLLMPILLAGIFTYLFARSIRLSPLPSALAASAYAFCGYNSRYINIPYLQVEWLIPLFLLTLDRLLKKKGTSNGVKRILPIIFIISIAIIGGHPQVAFYVFLFGLAYYHFRIKTETPHSKRKRFVYLLYLLFTLGVIFSSIQIIPFVELLGRSWTYKLGSGIEHLDLSTTIALFIPWFLGTTEKLNLFPLRHLPPYTGIITLIMASIAIARINRLQRVYTFLCGYALLFLLVAFFIPPFMIITLFPPFLFTSTYKYTFSSISFALSLLAGAGLDMYIRSPENQSAIKKGPPKIRWHLIAALIIILSFLVSLKLHHPEMLSPAVAPVLLCISLLFSLSILLFIYKKGRLSSRVFGSLTILLLISELFLLNRGHKRDYYPRELLGYYENTPAFSRVMDEQKPFRIYAGKGIIFPNWSLLLNLDNITSIEGLYNKDILKLFNEINEVNEKQGRDIFWEYFYPRPLADKLASPLLDSMNMKYLVTLKKVPSSMADKYSLLVDGQIKLYENLTVLPRTRIVSDVLTVTDSDKALNLLKSHDAEGRQGVIEIIQNSGDGEMGDGRWEMGDGGKRMVNGQWSMVNGQSEIRNPKSEIDGSEIRNLKSEIGMGRREDGRAKIVDYKDNFVKIKVDSKKGGFLILSDAYYPGWSALVDGARTTIYRADYMFRGVKVGPGEHEILFQYTPLSFKIGTCLSIATLLALIMIIPFYLRSKREEGVKRRIGEWED